MLSKTFIIPNKGRASLLLVSNYQFLVLEVPKFKTKYFFIPKSLNLKINKKDNCLTLTTKTKVTSCILSFQLFNLWLSKIRQLKKNSLKTILIRGIGLKASINSANPQILELKLGFSHFIYISIPSSITVLILKKKLLIHGEDSILVGNFSSKIYNFRKINIFTGKGLWLKNIQKFYCKPIKKR